MKLRIFLIIILLLTITAMMACADPVVSFTWSSSENKTVLTPNLNSDVTDYKWSIIGKRNASNLETGWIPYSDRGDHISMLETGTYFVTLTGRNTVTGLTGKFTNQVKVTVHEDYVKPKKEDIVEEDIGSRIIRSLPEPLRTFLRERTDFELLLIVFGSLFLLAIVTKRKKIKKYVKLERYNEGSN